MASSPNWQSLSLDELLNFDSNPEVTRQNVQYFDETFTAPPYELDDTEAKISQPTEVEIDIETKPSPQNGVLHVRAPNVYRPSDRLTVTVKDLGQSFPKFEKLEISIAMRTKSKAPVDICSRHKRGPLDKFFHIFLKNKQINGANFQVEPSEGSISFNIGFRCSNACLAHDDMLYIQINFQSNASSHSTVEFPIHLAFRPMKPNNRPNNRPKNEESNKAIHSFKKLITKNITVNVNQKILTKEFCKRINCVVRAMIKHENLNN